MQKQPVMPTPIRFKCDLKEWLKAESIKNCRSLNAEVIFRIEESKRNQENATA